MKHISTFLKMAVLLPALFSLPGATFAQEVLLPLVTGYQVKINGLPATVCQPSSALVIGGNYFNFPPISSAAFSTNLQTYHVATAGRTMTLVVDIPNVGALGFSNTSLFYQYGTMNGAPTIASAQPVNNPPAGFIRFELPVTFPLGNPQSYVAFLVRDQIGNPPQALGTLMAIPFVVLGPTHAEVAILGTTVQPQLPFMILHAPPGDGSSSEFQEGKTTCREFQDTYAEEGSNTANLAVKLGVAGSLGFVATVDFEFSVTFSGGVTAGDLAIKTSSNQTCVTVNEGFSTTELSGPDGGGDVFIGYGTDLNYGVYEYWKLNQNACNVSLDTGLIYTPTGNPRKFAYTKTAILAEIDNLQGVVADSLTVGPKVANDAQNQIDVWNQVLTLNDANVNNPNNTSIGAVNFSSGVNQTLESSITITETNAIQVEHYLEATAGLEAVVSVGGSGVTGGYEYKSSARYGKTQNQSVETSKVVKYTLADDDTGDKFNLNVVRDPMFGTPIFRIQSGTKSSCPYQGGYQRDQPRLKHTGQTVSSITLQGTPVGGSATYNLDVCNESNEARPYTLKLNPESNLNGAVVTAAGLPLNNAFGQQFNVPANGCLSQPLVIEVKMQSGTSPLSYPNLELRLESSCEQEIASSVFASVYFGTASGVNDPADNNLLAVSPNPTSGLLQIGLPQGMTMETVRVMDFSGKLVHTLNLDGAVQSYELDLSRLPQGVYGIQARSEGRTFTKKVVVE